MQVSSVNQPNKDIFPTQDLLMKPFCYRGHNVAVFVCGKKIRLTWIYRIQLIFRFRGKAAAGAYRISL